jgi:hypothetical protein
MNPNPDPFKHIRFIKTILQAFAFVTACCTVVWIALTKSNFQWNNRAVAIVALILLGFIAILMLNSLRKKDRPKTLVWIVVFLGSCITIIVLAVQDLIQQAGINPQTLIPLAQQPPINVGLKQQMTSNATVVIANGSKSELQNTGVVVAAVISSNFDTNDGVQFLQNNMVGDRLINRIWIIPDISILGTNIVGAPPDFQTNGETWVIRASHLAQVQELHEWYAAGPWTIASGSGVFLTNYVNILAPHEFVCEGTVYSVRTTNSYKLPLWHPRNGDNANTTGGGEKPTDWHPQIQDNGTTAGGGEKPTDVPQDPQWDSDHPHSILDFIKAFQSTNSPYFHQ